MNVIQASYFDGKSSRKHTVSIIVVGGKLKIVGCEIDETFDAKRVRCSLRVGNTPRWLYLPGGGACVTADHDAVDRVTRVRRYQRALHLWESSPAYAAIAIALVVGGVWLLMDRVVPPAVEYVATQVPPETESILGEQTLGGLEQHFLKPSKLPVARQEKVRAKFDAMAHAVDDTTAYRLEFRASPMMGPNAFALPSGIIVMTDELVRFSKNDFEVLGVLAHELGHVHHRHAMRLLLQSSATALIIAGITGDVASASSLVASAPLLLLQAKNSRESEREADRYSIDMMHKANFNPGHLAAILERMSTIDARGRKHDFLPPFLSSHPPTEEREALARSEMIPEEIGEDTGDDVAQTEVEPVDVDLVPEKPKSNAIVPAHREVVALVARRDIEALERLLGGYQTAFEADSGTSRALADAFRAFREVPRSAQTTLDEWCKTHPTSYAAFLARGKFFYYQGKDARGSAYVGETPEENLRTMHAFMHKARIDLEHSLRLTAKPYASRLGLTWIAIYAGSRGDEQMQYQEALKFAPQSVDLRLSHMTNLEPRWGGSYREMEAFVSESRAQLSDAKAADRVAARVPAYRAREASRANRAYPVVTPAHQI